jgi:poly-gamma-glutamate capsule biosynthesis protein CapA/YwtB (metallophosphatase superfamily)
MYKRFFFFVFFTSFYALHAQTDTLRLLFVGDIMGHTPQVKSAEVEKNKRFDYEPCFRYVKPIIEKADLAIGNLELTLPGKPPYTGYPMFRSPDALADALKGAGFDILVTANNHSNDARGPGVVRTLETLREKGFMQTGTFKNQKDRDAFYPLMAYKEGFKLAFLNYTYGTNGIPTEAPSIVNLLDEDQIKADLAEAKARKPHYVIVVVHWGLEYQLQENAEQRRLAKMMIQHGADLIIGAHPHVVQPIKAESVNLADGSEKEAIVVYSMGNFISNQRQPNTDGGIMFQIDLLKDKGSAKVRTGKYGYLPVWRYIHKDANGKITYYALPVNRLLNDPDRFRGGLPVEAKNGMTKFGTALRKRMTAPEWR